MCSPWWCWLHRCWRRPGAGQPRGLSDTHHDRHWTQLVNCPTRHTHRRCTPLDSTATSLRWTARRSTTAPRAGAATSCAQPGGMTGSPSWVEPCAVGAGVIVKGGRPACTSWRIRTTHFGISVAGQPTPCRADIVSTRDQRARAFRSPAEHWWPGTRCRRNGYAISPLLWMTAAARTMPWTATSRIAVFDGGSRNIIQRNVVYLARVVVDLAAAQTTASSAPG